ncbi:hypothetical protein ABGB18_49195 [Nonomuraea sp. B12E4]|uniref:hypothetical protein n=1 Tax=Nonomuraea sp. B12E4 TaxID=3153564 RepID=UPI00325C3BC5
MGDLVCRPKLRDQRRAHPAQGQGEGRWHSGLFVPRVVSSLLGSTHESGARMFKGIGSGMLVASLVTVICGASPAPASAASCVNVDNATHSSTAVSKLFGATYKTLKLEVRRGKVNGRWYGWARLSGDTKRRDTPALLVSFDGGKTSSVKCERGLVEGDGQAGWSGGYPESSSSKVRFRAIATMQKPGGGWFVGKTGWW